MFCKRIININIKSSNKMYSYENMRAAFLAQSGDIKSKTSALIDLSYEKSIENLATMLKLTEEKIKKENISDLDISVTINVGLVSITAKKRINE